jgi:hypothetical protein
MAVKLNHILKGDTDASILDGVKIVQKKVNNGVSKIRPRIKTNIFPQNNSESLTWSAKSVHCWHPNIFRLNWRKKCGKFKSVLFWRHLKYWHRYHPLYVVCLLFVFTHPGGTHDRCFQPVTRFLPSLGQNPLRGPIKPRVTQMAYVFWSLPHDAINTGLTAAPASPLYGSPVCKRSPI